MKPLIILGGAVWKEYGKGRGSEMTSTDIIRVITSVVVFLAVIAALNVLLIDTVQQDAALCHKLEPKGVYIRGTCYVPHEHGEYFINGKRYSPTWLKG